VPLTLALSPAQKADPKIAALAARLSKWLVMQGRRVEAGDVAPNGVILSPQPLKTSQSFPRWRTIESDLVLLGTPVDNILLFDQMRGGLLDAGSGAIVTHSPFVGEFNALNLIGDAAQIEAAMARLEAQSRGASRRSKYFSAVLCGEVFFVHTHKCLPGA
jgi:hypothetical protein